MRALSRHPSVIVLGGGANALSIARSLGRRGVRVFALTESDEVIRYSRFAGWIDPGFDGSVEKRWASYLLGPGSERFRSSVLLAASDSGLSVIARHRSSLQERYLLDLSDPAAQIRMLNKLTTYELARDAGVAVPGFWRVKGCDELLALRDSLVYPVLVKPTLSHVFEARFGKKFVTAWNFQQVIEAFNTADEAGVEVILMELVPGPDDLLCSYYTYLDEDGNALFDFTKRVIRRYPVGMGGGCYHVTDWIPEIKEEALKLFRAAGLRGLANAEFKRDPRDGGFKLIECNARFTAANCLVADSGLDLAFFVYSRLAGLPSPEMGNFRSGVRLWDPLRDFHSFRELRRRGEMTVGEWITSVFHPQTFPLFRWDDPLPGCVSVWREMKRMIQGRIPRFRYGQIRSSFPR